MTDLVLVQAAPVEAAPQPVNDTKMKACTEQRDHEKPMVTTAITDVKLMAIGDMADSRSRDPSGDEEGEEVGGDNGDKETDDGNDSGAEGEPVDVNVSCTMP